MSCIKELGLSAEEFNQFTKDNFKVYNCAVGEEIVLVLVELPIDEGDEITCGYYVFADDRLENMVRFFTFLQGKMLFSTGCEIFCLGMFFIQRFPKPL